MSTEAKVGRPTKYRPWMCDRVIALMAQGASKHEALADLGIWEDTFWRWRKIHPEFSEAVKIGTELSRMWWEREGRTALRDKSFNHGLWYMNMKNRFGWTDRVENTNNAPTSISVHFVQASVPTPTTRAVTGMDPTVRALVEAIGPPTDDDGHDAGG